VIANLAGARSLGD